MRARWLWLLAVAVPVSGGLAASATASDAWVVVTALAWIAGPVLALLAALALLRRLPWAPRVLVSVAVGMVWSVVAILLWAIGVAVGEGAEL